MVKKDTQFMARLIKEHERILGKVEDFSTQIESLQYEGKLYIGRNIKAIEGFMKYFQDELLSHMDVDEKAIFPFVCTHIPKLETIISFLSGEHEELRRAFRNFEKTLDELKAAKDQKKQSDLIDKLKNKGTYLACLMRNHIQTESESVYRAISKQLKSKEMKKLKESIGALS